MVKKESFSTNKILLAILVIVAIVLLVKYTGNNDIGSRLPAAEFQPNYPGEDPGPVSPQGHNSYYCGEDFHYVSREVLSQYYLDFFNSQYNDWYLCELDDEIKNSTGQECPQGWSGPYIGNRPYGYHCHKEDEEPNNLNIITGCSNDYYIEELIGLPPVFDNEYFFEMHCTKQGQRPENSPCEQGYSLSILLNLINGYVVCGQ